MMSFDDLTPEFSAPDNDQLTVESDLIQNVPDLVEVTGNFPTSEGHAAQEENDADNEHQATPEPVKENIQSSVQITNRDSKTETIKSNLSATILDNEEGRSDLDEEKKEGDQFSIKSDQVPQKTADDGTGMSIISELLGKGPARASEDVSIDLETFVTGSTKTDDAIVDTLGIDGTSVQTTPSVVEKLEYKTMSPTPSSPEHSVDIVSISSDFMGSDIEVNMPDHTSSKSSSSTKTIPSTSKTIESGTDEESREEPLEDEPLDRTMYYESYAMFKQQYNIEKSKNDFLHRLVADYYRKRKMFHVLAKETKTATEAHKKYNTYLEELDELQDTVHREEERVVYELQNLKDKCRLHIQEANAIFEKLQRAEFDVSKEFVDSENLKGTVEKIVERFIKRQKLHLTNLIKIRFSYIKCKNHLIEKQNQLKALDNLGSNFHLIDYEQLKHDNRNLKDKLEEKDRELTRIREKCQNAMQILAHRREKAAAMDADIKDMAERLESVKEEYDDVREQLNLLKCERDGFRNDLRKMKREAGLVIKPNLLRDMEFAYSEIGALSEEVKNCKKECWDITVTLNNMRQSMGSKTKLREIRKQMLASGADESSKSTSTSSASSDLKLEVLFA